MLTKQQLQGVWPALPIPWDRNDEVDAGMVDELVARYKAAGCAGVYTTGTDGEFFALDMDDFRPLVDAFAAAVRRHSIPAQVGCTWLHTKGVIERTLYACSKGVAASQVALPFWVAVNDDEMVGFFADLQEACPDVSLIHYNIARSGRFLNGADYARILPQAPNLIGSKHTGGDPGALTSVVTGAPQMNHLVVDGQMMPGRLLGAKGIYSFMANLNPVFTVNWWKDCEAGRWEEAARKRVLVDGLFREWRPLWGQITSSGALSKIATRTGILREMTLSVRKPYKGGSDADVDALTRLIDSKFSELKYHG